MAPQFALLYLFVGVLAGWLFGSITRTRPYGAMADVLSGAVGGVMGGWLFQRQGIPTHSLFWALISSLVAACLLLGLLRTAHRLAGASQRGRS